MSTKQRNSDTTRRNDDDLFIGAHVVDHDADPDDRNIAVVVTLPDAPAYDYRLDALDGSPSVADLNPAYGASGAVATVAFAGDLNQHADEWRDRDARNLAMLVADTDALTGYTYPVERLSRAATTDGGQRREPEGDGEQDPIDWIRENRERVEALAASDRRMADHAQSVLDWIEDEDGETDEFEDIRYAPFGCLTVGDARRRARKVRGVFTDGGRE